MSCSSTQENLLGSGNNSYPFWTLGCGGCDRGVSGMQSQCRECRGRLRSGSDLKVYLVTLVHCMDLCVTTAFCSTS